MPTETTKPSHTSDSTGFSFAALLPASLLQHVGRALLGFYFLGPGLMKLGNLEFYQTYMATHDVPLVVPALWLTIALQVGGGLLLMIGYRTALIAFLLAGLALLINIFMHDFWNLYEGLSAAHEQQNFVKNLGIIAGLLYVSGHAAATQRNSS